MPKTPARQPPPLGLSEVVIRSYAQVLKTFAPKKPSPNGSFLATFGCPASPSPAARPVREVGSSIYVKNGRVSRNHSHKKPHGAHALAQKELMKKRKAEKKSKRLAYAAGDPTTQSTPRPATFPLQSTGPAGTVPACMAITSIREEQMDLHTTTPIPEPVPCSEKRADALRIDNALGPQPADAPVLDRDASSCPRRGDGSELIPHHGKAQHLGANKLKEVPLALGRTKSGGIAKRTSTIHTGVSIEHLSSKLRALSVGELCSLGNLPAPSAVPSNAVAEGKDACYSFAAAAPAASVTAHPHASTSTPTTEGVSQGSSASTLASARASTARTTKTEIATRERGRKKHSKPSAAGRASIKGPARYAWVNPITKQQFSGRRAQIERRFADLGKAATSADVGAVMMDALF